MARGVTDEPTAHGLERGNAMECVIEKEISEDTARQIFLIAKDYVGEFFTENYPDDMRIDMGFQRAATLRENDEVVACIVFTCLDGSPHITMMATRRSHRGKGYGRLLMRHFVRHVSELGFHSIELYTFSPETRPVYASTVGFYQSADFRIEKEISDWWAKGEVTLKMRKSWT